MPMLGFRNKKRKTFEYEIHTAKNGTCQVAYHWDDSKRWFYIQEFILVENSHPGHYNRTVTYPSWEEAVEAAHKEYRTVMARRVESQIDKDMARYTATFNTTETGGLG